MTRFLALALLFVLLLRVLPLLVPFMGLRWQESAAKLRVTIDVAGGLILGLIIGSLALRGEPLGALVLTLIGIPVFIGMYRALPAWWRGQ